MCCCSSSPLLLLCSALGVPWPWSHTACVTRQQARPALMTRCYQPYHAWGPRGLGPAAQALLLLNHFGAADHACCDHHAQEMCCCGCWCGPRRCMSAAAAPGPGHLRRQQSCAVLGCLAAGACWTSSELGQKAPARTASPGPPSAALNVPVVLVVVVVRSGGRRVEGR